MSGEAPARDGAAEPAAEPPVRQGAGRSAAAGTGHARAMPPRPAARGRPTGDSHDLPASGAGGPPADRSWAGRIPVATLLRLAALAALLPWIGGQELAARAAGSSAQSLVWTASLALATFAWLGWALAPVFARGSRHTLAIAAVLVVAGTMLSVHAREALLFVGVGGMAVALEFDVSIAGGLSGLGPAVAGVGALLTGTGFGAVVDVGAAALVGVLLGASRRDSRRRIEQAATLRLERQRMEVERARADVLDERNRLAREIHDVLAHSLGALAVELEALDTLAGERDARDPLRARLGRLRSIVNAGLHDARRAVRALRDDPLPLPEQVARLARDCGADLRVLGAPRPIAPDAALTLYRAAQEALTNARKHAPGCTPEVVLDMRPGEVVLTVTNALSDAPAQAGDAGSGFGLQGMRERALLLGGEVQAGPGPEGWRVRVRLPV